MTAGELAGHFKFSWPALSQHLRVLKKTGLVKVRREGRFLWYRADPGPLERECAAWVLEYTAYWREHLGKLKTLVERPRRKSKRSHRRSSTAKFDTR